MKIWGDMSCDLNSFGSEHGQILVCFGNFNENLASKEGWTFLGLLLESEMNKKNPWSYVYYGIKCINK
jgi:hypothetical protein